MLRFSFLFSLFSLLVHCTTSNSSDKAVSTVPISIGAIVSATGSAAWLGEPEKRTLALLEDELNQNGGINGTPIRIYVEDSEGKPEKAVSAAKKLITQKKVLAIIGPSRSGSAIAVSALAERYQVPVVAMAASDKIILDQNHKTKPWVFTVAQKSSDAVVRIVDLLNELGIKKIGILSGSTGFGEDGRNRLKEGLADTAIQVVADEVYQPSDTDMSPQLLKIKRSGAEAIVNWSIVPAQAIVPKDMKRLKLNLPLIQSHGFANQKYLKAAGLAAEGLYFPGGRLLIVKDLNDNHPQKELMMNYVEKYEKEYDESASTFGGHAYDAFHLIVTALQQGAKTRKEIRDQIESSDFIGTAGHFQFSPSDHSGLDESAFALIQVRDQRFTLYKN